MQFGWLYSFQGILYALGGHNQEYKRSILNLTCLACRLDNPILVRHNYENPWLAFECNGHTLDSDKSFLFLQLGTNHIHHNGKLNTSHVRYRRDYTQCRNRTQIQSHNLHNATMVFIFYYSSSI